jgi:hypothetical protein
MKNKLIGRVVRLSDSATKHFGVEHFHKLESKMPCNIYETAMPCDKQYPFYYSFDEVGRANIIHPSWLVVEPIEEKKDDLRTTDNAQLLKAFETFCQDEFGVDILRMVHEFLESSESDLGGWISVEDRLPEIGQRVLIISEEEQMSVEQRFKNEDFIYSHQTDSGAAIFWMPLPKAPKLIQNQS